MLLQCVNLWVQGDGFGARFGLRLGGTEPAAARSIPSARRPAARPQNADPIPATVRPDAVTTKVRIAGKRLDSSMKADPAAFENAPISPSPATVLIRAGGNAAMTAITEAPKTARSR